MRTDFIPFKIGMEYENWEFDLEPVENTLEYDKYIYFKNDITSLFGFKVSRIFLYFSWDILIKVEIFFYLNYPKQDFLQFIEHIEKNIEGKQIRSKDETSPIVRTWIGEVEMLQCKLRKEEGIIFLSLEAKGNF